MCFGVLCCVLKCASWWFFITVEHGNVGSVLLGGMLVCFLVGKMTMKHIRLCPNPSETHRRRNLRYPAIDCRSPVTRNVQVACNADTHKKAVAKRSVLLRRPLPFEFLDPALILKDLLQVVDVHIENLADLFSAHSFIMQLAYNLSPALCFALCFALCSSFCSSFC